LLFWRKTVPEQRIPEQDPVTTKSYALHYTIAIVVLVGSLFWALWDEAYAQRPWKQFQRQFQERYSAFLKQARSQSAQSAKELESNSEYRALDDAYQSAEKQAAPQMQEIQRKLGQKSADILAVQNVFTDKRAYVNALTYDIETETSPSAKAHKQKALDKYKAQLFEVTYPDGSTKKYNYVQLEETYNALKDEKGALSGQLGELIKPINELKTKRDAWMSEHMVGLTPQQLAGLQKKVTDWDPDIVQINIPQANIVDRCESCHMGIREPLKLTAASMMAKGHKTADEFALASTSHPEPDLLKIHDPEKFGCSPCHQGNGRATTSVEKAHGNYEHWLWPMFKPANVEAGCQSCHQADMFLQAGSVGQVISDGKFLFRQRGCNGCHRYEGYDREPEDLQNIGQQIKLLEQQQRDNLRQAAISMKQADQAESNEEANRLNQKAEALRVENSKLAGRMEQLDLKSQSLMRDMKKIGPDLKEIRAKISARGWVPVWLHKPTDFRPDTKMPNFRLNDEQIKSIAAYLWQTALTDPLPKAKPGNAGRGKDLFETRGCLGCHSMGEGSERIGGDFAANLTRVGEKVNYDYLVRWIKNPRTRTRPYCPYEKKDIGPDDYAKHGLPYVFDFEHSKCPNDGHELQVEQMTVMPSLRLADEEVQDIATYLMAQKKKEPSSYADVPELDDPKLKAEGKKWISNFGCAGCHEIKGFEDEGRIGTELTQEGSKPIERLDFALLTKVAENGGGEPIKEPEIQARLPEGPAKAPWYNHKGFFEHKLSQPNVFDQGMIKSETEKLRMPDPHLTKEQVRALTTFLLGSQDSSLPAQYQYKPEDARHDIQEGWWIVRKYNCVGCHQFTPGQATAIETLPQYREVKEQLPPKLLTEGARVDPEWLLRFLSNPALSNTDIHRDGVRPYLGIRMPTFFFSNDELRKLVRFFQAMSQQPLPYIPQQQTILTAKEMDMARALFSSQAAPCLKCHATGDPQHDKTATAPNFLLAKERLKPGWTERWMLDPQNISPGTAMPSGLFRKQGEQWVFSGPTPPSFQGYEGDHTKLLVRYIFQLTPEEQRRVGSKMPRSAPAKTSQARPQKPAVAGGGSR
jgi:cytochrome c551/c552